MKIRLLRGTVINSAQAGNAGDLFDVTNDEGTFLVQYGRAVLATEPIKARVISEPPQPVSQVFGRKAPKSKDE